MSYTATSITLPLDCDEIIEVEVEVNADPEILLDLTAGELWFETRQFRVDPTFPNSSKVARFHFTPEHADMSKGLQRPARLLFKKDGMTYNLWSLSITGEAEGTATTSGILRLSRVELSPVRIIANQGLKGDKGDKGDGIDISVGDGLTRISGIISVDTTVARTAAVTAALAGKADTSMVNTALASKANTSDVAISLASKATTADLTAGLATKANLAALAAVAFSGSYNDLKDKPTSVGINDATSSTTTTYSSSKIEAIAALKAAATHNHDASAITSGTISSARLPAISYNALTDKPSLLSINDTAASATSVYSGNKVDALMASQWVDIQVFTASGMWNRPANARLVEVFLIGGGGGGGAGYKGAADSVRCGGGGGGGAALATRQFLAHVLTSTVSVDVAYGGTGATGPTTADTRAGSGTPGGFTRFGDFLYAAGGNVGGSGGLAISGTASVAMTGTGTNTGGAGAASSATGTIASAAPYQSQGSLAALGGGAGGGVTSANVPSAGGVAAGDYNAVTPGGAITSGIGGTSSTTSANAGTGFSGVARVPGEMRGATGGSGGGACSGTGAGGNGGYGAFPGGGGGGGGAATNGGGAAGSGGNGGSGLAIIITYF